MKKLLLNVKSLMLLAMLCLVTQSAMAFGDSKTFRYKVTAQADPTGAGLVYVSYSTAEPKASNYADVSYDEATSTKAWDEGEEEPMESNDGSIELWAKAKVGYKFSGWSVKGSEEIVSEDLHYSVEGLTVTSTDEENPTTFDYVARFVQTDTPEAGTYYIRNAALGTFITNGQWWGTHATLEYTGLQIEVAELPDGAFTLKTPLGYVTENEYVDTKDPTNWTIKHIGGGKFTIAVGDKKMGAEGVNVIVNAEAKNTEWELVPVADLLAGQEGAKAQTPFDATLYVKHPGFEAKRDSWTVTGTTNMNQLDGNRGGDFTPESWKSSNFSVSQKVEGLPAGAYKLSINGFYRYNTNDENINDNAVAAHADGTEVLNAYVEANSKVMELMSIADDETSAALAGKLPFSIAEAQAAFAQGLYVNEMFVEVGEDGVLDIAIKKDVPAGADWAVFDNIHLEYYGVFPKASTSIPSFTDEEMMSAIYGSEDYVLSKVLIVPGLAVDSENLSVKLESRDEDLNWNLVEGVEVKTSATAVEGEILMELNGFKPEWGGGYRVVFAPGSLLFMNVLSNSEDYILRYDAPYSEPKPRVSIAEDRGGNSYTITANRPDLPLMYICKTIEWLDEGQTPDDALNEELEDLSGSFSSAEDFENFFLPYADKAPKTIVPANYTELNAGKQMFIIAGLFGWNEEEGKVTFLSDASNVVAFFVPSDEPAEAPNILSKVVNPDKQHLFVHFDSEDANVTSSGTITLEKADGTPLDVAVSGEYGENYGDMIYTFAQALEDGSYVLVCSEGSMTFSLSGDPFNGVVRIPFTVGNVPGLATVAINEDRGGNTYTVTSDDESLLLYLACHPMNWMQDGQTPEEFMEAELEELNEYFTTEEDFNEYYIKEAAVYAPQTIDPEEIIASLPIPPSTTFFAVAANIGWDKEQGKIVFLSNISNVIYFTSPAAEPVKPESITVDGTTIDVLFPEGTDLGDNYDQMPYILKGEERIDVSEYIIDNTTGEFLDPLNLIRITLSEELADGEYTLVLPEGMFFVDNGDNNEEMQLFFLVGDVPEMPNVTIDYVDASSCVIVTFEDYTEVDLGPNKDKAIIDGKPVTLEWGEYYNQLYIHEELGEGKHEIIFPIGSITLDGVENTNTIVAIFGIDPTTAIKAIGTAGKKDGKVLESGKIVIYKNGMKFSTNGARL